MTGPESSLNTNVPVGLAGRRFDQALAELFPDYSRSRLTAWIKSGAALLDGKVVAPRHIVHGGEQVALTVRIEREIGAAPEAIELDIRHEDADVIIVNKPPGLVVHPGAGNPSGTLQNALLHHDPGLAGIPRGGIVHRLDKDTSGLMAVARSLRAHTSLVAQLAARSVHRQYAAIVYGAMVRKLCSRSQGQPLLGSRNRAMIARSRCNCGVSVMIGLRFGPGVRPPKGHISKGLWTNLCSPVHIHISHNV